MKICDACGEVGFSQPSCRGDVCPNRLQLDQALSQGPLLADEFKRDWWNRYLIDRESFKFGYDLTDWALPLKISIWRYGVFIGFLCFDIDIDWGNLT